MTVEAIKRYLAVVAELQEAAAPRPGLTAPARFMLEHGREFRVTPKTFAGPRGTPKECYANAGRIAVWDDPSLIYVEGYVTVCGVAIPHAWLANGDEVIDPTLEAEYKDGEPREAVYFGLPFRTDYLRRTISKTGYWGLLDCPNPITQHEIAEGRTDGMLVEGGDALVSA